MSFILLVRHKKDLSAKIGKIILLEYVEEFPPIIVDFGMGAKIKNYYRVINENDDVFKNEDGKTLIHNGEGETVVLNNDGETVILNNDSNPGISPFDFSILVA